MKLITVATLQPVAKHNVANLSEHSKWFIHTKKIKLLNCRLEHVRISRGLFRQGDVVQEMLMRRKSSRWHTNVEVLFGGVLRPTFSRFGLVAVDLFLLRS